MSCRHECTCCLAVFILVLVKRIVVSPAYVISFILLFGGVGKFDVYFIK